MAYMKVYQDLKLCKVGRVISESDFFEMTDYLLEPLDED